jgi:hypothetical protein
MSDKPEEDREFYGIICGRAAAASRPDFATCRLHE